MKSLIYALFISFSVIFIISCSDSNAPTSTGPNTGTSTKLDTLESPVHVWIDTAAIFIDTAKDSINDSLYLDTIIYETHYDSNGTILVKDTVEIIVLGDTIVKNNKPLGMIRVKWTPVKDANYYYVLVEDTGKANLSYYHRISDSVALGGDGYYSLVVDNLLPEYSYKASVFGYNSIRGEKGARTESDRIVNLKGSPSPTNLTVDVFGGTAIINWSAVEDARKYNVIITNLLTGDSIIETTIADETSLQTEIEKNHAYSVRIVPEGFAVVDSSLAVDSMLVELGPSFTKVDTIYPYDPTISLDSTTFYLPFILFSTYTNTSAPNKNMVAVDGGYYLKGNIWSVEKQDSLEKVVLSPFNIGEHEVTNNDYFEFLNSLILKNDTLVAIDSGLITFIDTLRESLLYSKIIKPCTLSYTLENAGDTITKSFAFVDTIAVLDTTIEFEKTLDANDIANLKLDTIIENVVYKASLDNNVFNLSITYSDDSLISDSTFTVSYIVPNTITANGSIEFPCTLNFYAEPIYEIREDIYRFTQLSRKRDSVVLIESGSIFTLDDSNNLKSIDPSFLSLPISGVSWEGAAVYCNWLSEYYGYNKAYDESNNFQIDTSVNGYRLPTEAEFEFIQSVSFLGSKQKYPWGADPSVISKDSTYNSITSIDNLKSYFGLKGITGNVLEWCSDKWDYGIVPSISYDIRFNPINLTGADRLMKGGSFIDADKATSFVSSYNISEKPLSLSSVGFRVARWPK